MGLKFRVQGLVLRVQGAGCKVQSRGSGIRIRYPGLKAQGLQFFGLRLRTQRSGLRVKDVVFRVPR